jgi:hypothetical protein
MEMKWIDVKDKLPPYANYTNFKYYLIFCKYITIAIWYNDKWIDNPDGFYKNYDPTHWMPLPAPPDNK